MHQHVTTPTRDRGTESPSVLDIAFPNEADMVEDVTTNAPLGASDHSFLDIDFRCHPGELPPRVSYSYEKSELETMREAVIIDLEKLFENYKDDVNTQWEIFHNKHKQLKTHVSLNRRSVYPSSKRH